MSVRAVVSCPPCRLPVDTKTPAALPSSSPLSQSDVSWAIWFLSCAATFPKRVGVPKAIAPASAEIILSYEEHVPLHLPPGLQVLSRIDHFLRDEFGHCADHWLGVWNLFNP